MTKFHCMQACRKDTVYHEGRSFRVVKAMLSLGHRDSVTADAFLPTMTVRICRKCGAGHFSDELSMCHGCGDTLDKAEIINNVYRIENVSTWPVERITANDEERQRQGFDLQTVFKWAVRDGNNDVRKAIVADDVGDILQLAYGQGATITRINKGLRRRADRTQYGFRIDPVSGYWAKNEDENGEDDPTANPKQWIVPCVQDRKNALLLQPVERELSQTTLTTFQHALMRGIETVFQLEPSEILAEPMPTRDERSGCLLYEAAEGGAGVLNRLVGEPDTMATVARVALSILHCNITKPLPLPTDVRNIGDVDGTSCVAACYSCLMSYYNQPEHELLDRRDSKTRELLLRLAHGQTYEREKRPSRHPDARPSDPPTGSGVLERRFCEILASLELPPPDPTPWSDGKFVLPFVWRRHYVAAVFSGLPPVVQDKLNDQGFEVFSLGETEGAWAEALEPLSAALGKKSEKE